MHKGPAHMLHVKEVGISWQGDIADGVAHSAQRGPAKGSRKREDHLGLEE